MKKKYETPEVKLYMARLRSAILIVSGGDDNPDIPPMPEGI